MKFFITFCIAFAAIAACTAQTDKSATDVLGDMYTTCLTKLSVSCVKPKALAWISEAVKNDKIRITDELSIIRTANDDETTEARSDNPRVQFLEMIQGFLATHSLRMEVPKFLQTKEAGKYIPASYMKGGLASGLTVPLSEDDPAEGRGLVKKIIIPFILGLKFKTTVMVPLALAMIALKTWKAMTLGLLSIVLSGALVIFKLAKPKVAHYEVIHYPHPHPHHHHHVEHHVEHPPHHGWDAQPVWGRTFDGQDLAYAGQR